jgi:hypothetical protein
MKKLLLAALAVLASFAGHARGEQPQSQAQDFIVTAKDTQNGLVLRVKEGRSRRLLLNRVMNGVALHGDLNTARRVTLAITSQNSGPNMPIASGAFIISSDKLSNGVYEASVHRARSEEIRVMSPEEQAHFQAWVKQWQPTPCVKDASLPIDTVRLQAGAETKIRPGYFFSMRPVKPPDYVPMQYIPAKVLRNDGKFLGWQYFAPMQLDYAHEQLAGSPTVSLGTAPSESPESNAQSPGSAAVATKPADDSAKTDVQTKLRADIETALGKSYRNVPRVWEVQFKDQVVSVRFSIDDNLTAGLIKGSAKSDIKAILKAVQDAGFPYSEINVVGTLDMQDKFGNSQEDEVVRATYLHSTVNKINWSGFLTDNIYAIADNIWLHRAFQ